MSDKKKYPSGKHPNSLAALNSPYTSETAKAAQLLGAKARSANATKRKEMRESVKQWMMLKDEVLSEDISAVDTLKLILAKAIHESDFDMAVELASKLAEYERPKLARKELKIEDDKADVLTDAELNAKLQQLLDEN